MRLTTNGTVPPARSTRSITSATLPPVVTTSSTTKTRAPGGTRKRSPERHAPILSLAEDEVDPQGLRDRESEDDATDRRRGHEVEWPLTDSFANSLGDLACEPSCELGVLQYARALDVSLGVPTTRQDEVTGQYRARTFERFEHVGVGHPLGHSASSMA